MLVKLADSYKSLADRVGNAETATGSAAVGGKHTPADLYAEEARSAARQRVNTAGKSNQRGGQRAAYVKCREELSSGIKDAFHPIKKRSLGAMKKELPKRLGYRGLWQRAVKYATPNQNADMEKLRLWILDEAERIREIAPNDGRLLCSPWDDVATSGKPGVYVLNLRSGKLKLGMSINLQGRTNEQADKFKARAVFALLDEMIPNGLITEEGIKFILGLDLPVFAGCDRSQQLQRTIIMNQMVECIFTLVYEIDSPGPLFEFLLMHGDDDLARLTDAQFYLKKIEKRMLRMYKDYPELKKFTVTKQLNMDTWRTPKDEASMADETKHLLNINLHPSRFASRFFQQLLVDDGSIESPVDPCTEYSNGELQLDAFGENSPYFEELMSRGILYRLREAVRSGNAADIAKVLDECPRETYRNPADLDGNVTYAAKAKTNFDAQMSQLREESMMSLRTCTWDVIKESSGGEKWLEDRGLLKGLKMQMPEIKRGSVTVVPSVRVTLFFAYMPGESKTRMRAVLVHGSTWPLVGPIQSYALRFSAIATIMLVSGFNYLVGLLSAEGLYKVSRLMKSCALVLCGPNNSLGKSSGSANYLYHLVLPKGLIIARRIPGAAIPERELRNRVSGVSFPFEALVLLLTKLGMGTVNTMLRLVGSVCQFGEFEVERKKLWLLMTRTMYDGGEISEDGEYFPYYLMYNEATKSVHVDRAMASVMALVDNPEVIWTEKVREILDEMNEGAEQTNFPAGAKRNNKARLLKLVVRELPQHSDIHDALKSVDYREGIDAERFNVHLDALKKYIDDHRDGSLGDEYRKKVFLPDYYKIDHGTYRYYINLIRRGKDGIGLSFSYELERLGIYIQEKEEAERAIEEAQVCRTEGMKIQGRAITKSYR